MEDRPDVFVLNTCSVTENADRECRRHVRRFRGINKGAFIVVVGCYAQLKPQEIAAIPGVDLVLGANEKFDLAAHRKGWTAGRNKAGRCSAPSKEVARFIPSYNAGEPGAVVNAPAPS